jgi:hypothetical protein
MQDGMTSKTDLSLPIDIGRIPIRIRTGESGLAQQLGEHYAGFVTSSHESTLKFEIHPKAVLPGADSDEGRLRVKHHSGRWSFQSSEVSAEWETGRNRIVVRQTSGAASIDYLLRMVHTLLLIPEGGFLLHASSVRRSGRAVLFVGASGAGKSTISSLAPPDATLLGDDTSYVRRQNGDYHAFGTPFSPMPAKRGVNVSAPISGVYFLEQGPTNRIEPIPPPEALRRLMGGIRFFSDDALFPAEHPDLVRQIFASAVEFLQAVPAHRLTFAPDRRVWGLLI